MLRHPLGFLILPVFMTLLPSFASAQPVISHNGVEVTRAEFEAILETSPTKLVSTAADDLGDRYEFINGILSTRKLAASVDSLAEDDPDYWKLYFTMVAAKAEFALNRLMEQIELEDPSALAAEYYLTKKEKYAVIPEVRASSHILLASPPGLNRTDVRALGQEIYDKLVAGADWEALVAEYSDDPGSAERGGSLNRSVSFGDTSITPPYTEALFKIEEVGDFIVAESQFGVHIIRLDGITPKSYKEFREVSTAIVKDIRAEQRKLALSDIKARFNIGEDAFIDGAAMEELFAPYKSQP